MLKYLQWILPIVAVVTILSILLWGVPETSEIEYLEPLEIEELQRENKVLIQAYEELEDQLIATKAMTDSLQNIILSEQQAIERLQHQKDEAITAVDTFTDDELYHYFSGVSTQATNDRR